MSSISDRLPPPSEVLDLVRGSQRFLLCGHVRPDGDCLGAQLALHGVLRALGKTVRIVNPDPLAPQYDYLSEWASFEVYAGGELFAHDVAVVLDFCELARCGPLEAPLTRARSRKLVVDHHLFHAKPWWDLAFVDPQAASTGLLVRRMGSALGVAVNSAIAHGVFTSLVSDTGWFKYSNTDQETFDAAAEATRAGVLPQRLYASIYQRQPREHPAGLARALARLEYHAQGRLAVVGLPLARERDADLIETDDLLDLLRSVRTVEVVLFLREQKDGTVKLSARSKTDFDVNRLARRFGGGGHAKASGATLAMGLDAARAALTAAALEELASASAR
jgi:phosphoesterase RecJ-like protein